MPMEVLGVLHRLFALTRGRADQAGADPAEHSCAADSGAAVLAGPIWIHRDPTPALTLSSRTSTLNPQDLLRSLSQFIKDHPRRPSYCATRCRCEDFDTHP
jgi:hypothetical protein